jgi:hypothetical protein
VILPDDLDLDTADRAEIIEKLTRDGVYTREAAEAIADMVEAGEPIT